MAERLHSSLSRDTILGSERDRKGITYAQFKKISPKDIVVGTIVQNISPAKLWASQDWVDPEKIGRVQREEFDSNTELVLEAYYHDMPTGQRALILANGHHHALRAWEEAEKVSIVIKGEYPPDKDFISFSRYRRETGNAFRGL